MEFITNNKGGIKLCYEGFMYTKKCAQGRKIRWKCSQAKAYGCNACLFTTLEKEDPCLTKQHSHEPDVKAIEVAKGKAAMKEKAKVSREKPGQILATQLTNLRSLFS